MFFLLRSACCIGLVVAALPNGALQKPGALAGSARTAALSGAEQMCRAAPGRCLGVLADGLRLGSADAFASLAYRAPPSRDTLSSTDRRPAWAGPVVNPDD